MARIIYQNANIVALNEQMVTMQDGSTRRKLEIQLTENTKDGMLIIGGIEAWDDSIDKLDLTQGATFAEIHCVVRSRYKDGRWWWSVQAYKSVKEAPQGASNEQSNEGGDPFGI